MRLLGRRINTAPAVSFVSLRSADQRGWVVPGTPPRHLRAAAPPLMPRERPTRQGRAGPAGPATALCHRPTGGAAGRGGKKPL
ncbi:hypothetical protein NDU88_006220 [Pleurodeles waltl]|uniref:Uncharacterized protein n=1 Tax=Pleurodeles waltl TaxID=8319 RepID=A0AAV7W9Z0_PLEWA|nr:hypothetical protein NDU88_006220 [Pleurodeles waltl]